MSNVDFLIKNVSLPDGKVADIGITDGVISSVGKGSKDQATNSIDGSGFVALPGLADVASHL